MSEVRFPKIQVQLTGTDGNAFAVMAKVSQALRRGGATPAEIEEYQRESMSGDYSHLLATAMEGGEVA